IEAGLVLAAGLAALATGPLFVSAIVDGMASALGTVAGNVAGLGPSSPFSARMTALATWATARAPWLDATDAAVEACWSFLRTQLFSYARVLALILYLGSAYWYVTSHQEAAARMLSGDQTIAQDINSKLATWRSPDRDRQVSVITPSRLSVSDKPL